jgi:hypothetical protein
MLNMTGFVIAFAKMVLYICSKTEKRQASEKENRISTVRLKRQVSRDRKHCFARRFLLVAG